MGEIADMMLDGTLDAITGEYIGKAIGYPRTREKGYYNTESNFKSVGGVHLIGKKVFTKKYGNCIITDYIGKKGKRKYVLIDEKGNEYKVKFNTLIFKK